MTATVGGAVPTPPNNTTTFLRGDGTFAAPSGSGSGKSVQFCLLNATVPASSTRFGWAQNFPLATEGDTQFPFPTAGTIRNLYIRTSNTQNAGGSLVLTVRLNGADTALVATVTAGGAAGVYSDTSNSFTVAAGDVISFKYVNNYAGGISAVMTGISFEFQAS